MNSNAKGKRGERELANKLKAYGYETIGLKGIYIECKRVQSLNMDNVLEKCDKEHKDPDIPVVMHRKNGKEWKVTMYLPDFMHMYDEWKLKN